MADDDYRMRQPRLVFLWQEGPTERGLHAEHVKIIARNQIPPDPLVIAVPAQAHIGETAAEQSRQDFVAVTEIEVVRIGERGHFPVFTDRRNRDDFLSIGHRQRAEQNQVDQTEYRRIRADAQRERKNGDEGEARRFDQTAKAEPYVLPECLHNPSQRTNHEETKSTKFCSDLT